ncbi:hypothetical protein DFH09DRAFT_1448198 [Mycena vulgaris]|nr:hypothetical protein DFH09DRAFT_1448198 [Mycena vulgaris]
MHLLQTVGFNPAISASIHPQPAGGAAFHVLQYPTAMGGPQPLSQPNLSLPSHPVTGPAKTPPRWRICYHRGKKDQYHGFSNSSAYPVKYNGKEYPTSEHLYQASKYMENRPDIAEQIRTVSKSPARAHNYSKANMAHQHPDWDRMSILKMEIAYYHKFTQNVEFRQKLLGTGDAELVNYTQNDFWGVGKDLKGRNECGKALERVRSSLREVSGVK